MFACILGQGALSAADHEVAADALEEIIGKPCGSALFGAVEKSVSVLHCKNPCLVMHVCMYRFGGTSTRA